MGYRKYCNSLKGVNLKWEAQKVFPNYTYKSGPIVSRKIIKRAVEVVRRILTHERKKIEKAFKTLADIRYGHNKARVTFDYDNAYRRVLATKLCPANEYCYGESDNTGIWICKNKIHYAELVGTILHESLHYFAYFNDKEICEKDDHYVMRMLGDDC